MLFSGVALVLVLLLHVGPDTPFYRALRVCLVERPAKRLAAMERHDVMLLIILPAIFLTGGELLLLFGPEFLALYAANLAFYLDAMIMSALLATTTALRTVAREARAHIYNLRKHVSPASRPASREIKTRTTSGTSAKNDDDCTSFLKLAA